MKKNINFNSEFTKFSLLFVAICVLFAVIINIFGIGIQSFSCRIIIGSLALFAYISLAGYQTLIDKRNNIVFGCLVTSLIVLISFSYPLEITGYNRFVNEYTSLLNAFLSVIALLLSTLWISISAKGGTEDTLSSDQKFTLALLLLSFILATCGLVFYTGYIATIIAFLSAGLVLFQTVVMFKELKKTSRVIYALGTLIVDLLILGYIVNAS
ncbi:TPA: hypothetical protein ACF5BV_004731 [Vibrio parahaemolyticus]|nr:hypothetical protein [Vibrio parahaemolyticus]HCH6179929.1 hypothetical protein [Vibrio parahaemolyticus]HCH6572360.1 hypothetical protein [Vibrio parahaemolyticus]